MQSKAQAHGSSFLGVGLKKLYSVVKICNFYKMWSSGLQGLVVTYTNIAANLFSYERSLL